MGAKIAEISTPARRPYSCAGRLRSERKRRDRGCGANLKNDYKFTASERRYPAHKGDCLNQLEWEVGFRAGADEVLELCTPLCWEHY